MIWDSVLEKQALNLRLQGKTYSEIAKTLGTTSNSVKHKVRRLSQAQNQDKYHHPQEKIDQIRRILPKKDLHTLEMHTGFGNLTKIYQEYGSVLGYDIEGERVDYIQSMCMQDVDVVKGDSQIELLNMVYQRLWFDVVDIDPYGLPSRYFPLVFNLINDGWLFLTFPKLGVAQINKITVRHYQAFWGFELDQKAQYVEIIQNKLKDYAYQCFRKIEVLEVLDLDRVYRFAIKVKKESALDLVGLKVNRGANAND